MNRWLKRQEHDYLELDDLDQQSQQHIRQTIAGIESAMDGPFLNKNVMHGVRLLALSGLFPNAVFIVTRRKYLAVAQSILRARIDYLGAKNAWFSVRPRDWDGCRSESYVDQVCNQIWMYEQDCTRGIDAIGHDRFFYVPYRCLCQRPQEVMNRVNDFLERWDIHMGRRNNLPVSFTVSDQRSVDEADYAELGAGLERLGLIDPGDRVDEGANGVDSER